MSVRRLALIAGLALLQLSCAALPTGAVARLPAEARNEPSSFVVVTVRNDPRGRTATAGATPRGYEEGGAYGVSAVASSTVRALEHAYGLRQVSSWPISTLRVHCVVFRVPTSRGAGLLARLSHDPRVESAQPLNEFTTQSAAPPLHRDESSAWMPYNDPYGALQSSLRELNVIAAQRVSRGAGVRIAIIDTGLDDEHPDLQGRVIERRNFVDTDAREFRRDRHGLAVAGIIAAVANNSIGIVGIAPESHLIALKACWHAPAGSDRAVCNSFTLAQALEAAMLARADVVNLSLSGPADALLERLVRRGLQQGILFVGAVAPPGIGGAFPTQIPGVLAVQAQEDAASGAPRVLAPGHDILTLVPGGQYDFASGSSLATAEVSGVLALLRARHPGLSAQLAESALLRSQQLVPTAAGRAPHIDACAALNALEPGSCGGGAAAAAGFGGSLRAPAAPQRS